MQIYDDAMQKAFDGRKFDNPCKPGTLAAKAWEIGTKEGVGKREAGLPHSIALPTDEEAAQPEPDGTCPHCGSHPGDLTVAWMDGAHCAKKKAGEELRRDSTRIPDPMELFSDGDLLFTVIPSWREFDTPEQCTELGRMAYGAARAAMNAYRDAIRAALAAEKREG